jgi:hypothetical protein
MIEELPGFPDGVVAFAGKGQVSKKDYDEVLIPKVEAAFRRHKNLRMYYELGSQFTGIDPGAAWDDLLVGVEHWTHWQRAAIVTDAEWLRRIISTLRFLIPHQVRLFGTAQAAEAKRWVTASEQ